MTKDITKGKFEYVFPDYLSSMYGPDDLISIVVERNGCNYRWGIPLKNIELFQKLEEPFSFDDLQAMGGKIQDILVFNHFPLILSRQKPGFKN
jgi:hypothetical protein